MIVEVIWKTNTCADVENARDRCVRVPAINGLVRGGKGSDGRLRVRRHRRNGEHISVCGTRLVIAVRGR